MGGLEKGAIGVDGEVAAGFVVPPREHRIAAARTSGVLPLGLGGEAPVRPLGIGRRLAPGHAGHGMVRLPKHGGGEAGDKPRPVEDRTGLVIVVRRGAGADVDAGGKLGVGDLGSAQKERLEPHWVNGSLGRAAELPTHAIAAAGHTHEAGRRWGARGAGVVLGRRLVDATVAVIVDAVADLRDRGVAAAMGGGVGLAACPVRSHRGVRHRRGRASTRAQIAAVEDQGGSVDAAGDGHHQHHAEEGARTCSLGFSFDTGHAAAGAVGTSREWGLHGRGL